MKILAVLVLFCLGHVYAAVVVTPTLTPKPTPSIVQPSAVIHPGVVKDTVPPVVHHAVQSPPPPKVTVHRVTVQKGSKDSLPHVIEEVAIVGGKMPLHDALELTSVPERVKNVVKMAHHHIPQVINHHVTSHKATSKVTPHDNTQKAPHVPNVPQVPSHVQHVVGQVHHHVPQVINHHIATTDPAPVPSKVQTNVPVVAVVDPVAAAATVAPFPVVPVVKTEASKMP